jgi:hypothetical protein
MTIRELVELAGPENLDRILYISMFNEDDVWYDDIAVSLADLHKTQEGYIILS